MLFLPNQYGRKKKKNNFILNLSTSVGAESWAQNWSQSWAATCLGPNDSLGRWGSLQPGEHWVDHGVRGREQKRYTSAAQGEVQGRPHHLHPLLSCPLCRPSAVTPVPPVPTWPSWDLLPLLLIHHYCWLLQSWSTATAKDKLHGGQTRWSYRHEEAWWVKGQGDRQQRADTEGQMAGGKWSVGGQVQAWGAGNDPSHLTIAFPATVARGWWI